MTRPIHGGNLAWAATIAKCLPAEILDFSASINPLGPPESILGAIQSNLDKIRAYPDPQYGELRKALSLFHKISPDWILPGNGAAELLTWAAFDLAELAVTYILTPAFHDYQRALSTFQVKVQECPFIFAKNQCILPDFSSWQIKNDEPAGIILNNPHNPTGSLIEKDTILSLLDKFQLVVIDEAFMDFLPPDQSASFIDQIADYPHLIIVRSLTKFYSMPGLRLGYAIAHPDRIKQWQKWRDPWSVNVLAIEAGKALINDQKFAEKTWTWLTTARRELFNNLQNIPGLTPLPSVANFLLVASDQSVEYLQLQLLTKYQILIRDCASFPLLGDQYFRIAVRTKEENMRLINALQEIIMP